MGEDNKNLKELHIIDGATGEEIPVTPIKELVLSEKEGEFEENLDEWFKGNSCKPIGEAEIEIEIDTEPFKEMMKKLVAIAQLQENEIFFAACQLKNALRNEWKTITKKRARKLLMAHGYDRNRANQTLKFLHKRTLNEIKKYFIF